MKNQKDTIKAKDVVIINGVIYELKHSRLIKVRALKYITKEGKIISENFVKDYNPYNFDNN